MVLFLFGLLNGVVVPYFENPRMGLPSHLAGVQNALVLLAFGAIWNKIKLSQIALRWCFWLSVYGMYSIWASLVLAAIFGTSSATPIAGNGFAGTQYQELTVNILLYTGSIAIIIASLQIILGLIKNKKNVSQP